MLNIVISPIDAQAAAITCILCTVVCMYNRIINARASAASVARIIVKAGLSHSDTFERLDLFGYLDFALNRLSCLQQAWILKYTPRHKCLGFNKPWTSRTGTAVSVDVLYVSNTNASAL